MLRTKSKVLVASAAVIAMVAVLVLAMGWGTSGHREMVFAGVPPTSTPTPKPTPTGNLSGVYDIWVNVNNKDPAIGLYHCISRWDHDAKTNEIKVSAQCYADADIGDPNSPLPDLEGEGPSGDSGAAGPPPPPPYTVVAPTKLNGVYDPGTDTLTMTGCFADVGGVLGPNIIWVVIIPNTKAELTNSGKQQGILYLYGNQSIAQCDSKVPSGDEPVPLPINFHPIKDGPPCSGGDCLQAPWRTPGDQDFDDDGCTDFQELDKTGAFECGDDPYNPYDSDENVDSIYNALITIARQDIDKVSGVPIPGAYIHCIVDMLHDKGTNDLESRVYCYMDTPGIPVNPENSGSQGGDGDPGSPPPKPYGDVDGNHAVLPGRYDKVTNEISTSGCMVDKDGQSPLGNVFASHRRVDARTGQGSVDIWILQTEENCTGGTPEGDPTFDDARLEVAEQATRAENRDSDGDGCPDKAELSDDQTDGGLRDPFNKWDYFNPTNDGVNRSDDILLIIIHYRDDLPPPDGTYDTKYDRTGVPGSNDWNFGPPNGTIRSQDILAAVKSYRHDCGDGSVWPAKPTPWATPAP